MRITRDVVGKAHTEVDKYTELWLCKEMEERLAKAQDILSVRKLLPKIHPVVVEMIAERHPADFVVLRHGRSTYVGLSSWIPKGIDEE